MVPTSWPDPVRISDHLLAVRGEQLPAQVRERWVSPPSVSRQV